MSERLLDLGKEWGARIKGLFESPLQADAPPLELVQAVLDDLERRVQAAGRGRRVFPYTAILVRIAQPGAEPAAILTAFDDLAARVRERILETGGEPPSVLDVDVQVLDATPQGWRAGQLFALECRRPAPAARAAHEPLPMEIIVARGAAEEAAYRFTGGQISIGRTPEAIDDLGRARRNRVAFLDVVDGVTETVGRAHARLRADPATGEYLVFDDGSRNGTSLIRDGETIPVRPRDPRGVRVQSGDELQVGRAVLRISIGTASSPRPPSQE